jgi:adhesin transport system outer membrane protein
VAARKYLSLFCATTLLAGCMDGNMGGFNFTPPHLAEDGTAPASASAAGSAPQTRSAAGNIDVDTPADGSVVKTLVARRSVLPAGSPYDKIGRAALAAGSRSAESELRSAKLRAEAENKNWLPTVTPNISLTSLGETLASLVVDQVLYDNGKRKAERAYAAADVEVAAVSLSQDQNDRVFNALKLYLTGLRGDEKSATSTKAIKQMRHFKRIVDGRVSGGVSDKGDQRMVEGKLLDLSAERDLAQEEAAVARAELQAMLGGSAAKAKVTPLKTYAPSGLQSLSVLKAEAEAKRTVAQATADRAAQLPGLSASGTVNKNGTSAGLNAGTTLGLGFGTKARLDAIENSKETARENVVEAREAARRNQSRLEQRLISLQRQEAETAKLVRESRQTFSLFQSQFKAGQRSVLEVVNIYEQLTRREMERLDAKYDVILVQLELARDLGVLADGGEI